ncbi:MAG TPA: GNAT family N-acetyltransferase [Gaiellaceae bacterium]|nr:GNAT family N-acetyltransferase [Gaiellaceae bacterium]
MPATVLTERLLLRRWRVGDAAPLAEIYSQPEYLATMPPATAAEQIPMWERRWDEDGFAPWAACVRGSGRLIGRIGLLRHHDWPLEPDVVEVGWVLHRDFWGRGLATEGGRVSIAIWREHFADDRLYSFTVPSNVRSLAVMERLGMCLGGRAAWRGLEHIWYVLHRSEAVGP